jgi:hypothetical protein
MVRIEDKHRGLSRCLAELHIVYVASAIVDVFYDVKIARVRALSRTILLFAVEPLVFVK